MDSSATMNASNKELHMASNSDSGDTIIPLENPNNVPTIVVHSPTSDTDLSVTPAFPNFSTNEEVVNQPVVTDPIEPSNTNLEEDEEEENKSALVPMTTPNLPQQNTQLLDELKYLLKPTNSLATSNSVIQESQEADAAIKRRTLQFDENLMTNANNSLIDDLTPNEIKSLNAAERRSIASRSHRSSSNADSIGNGSRNPSMQPSIHPRTQSQSSSSGAPITQPEQRTLLSQLSGLTWAFIAAYSFTIILFLTRMCGIDLIFGFFLQMIIQTIAFGVYAFYKGYNLLGPSDHRTAMICRAVLIGIGSLTSFLAYYFITIVDLSAIRQSQVIVTVILSIVVLHERATIVRIVACGITFIAIMIFYAEEAFSSYNTFWNPNVITWNHLLGISLALCTAITHSMASTMNKRYFSIEQLHNTVLCFWSAISAFIISSIALFIKHFFSSGAHSHSVYRQRLFFADTHLFPHDWRLFVSFLLALASIFVFIANQKAIKRGPPSIVTLVYSTDIVLALILHNIFSRIKSSKAGLLGCVLILISVLVVCLEVFIAEKNRKKMAIKIVEAANASTQKFDLPKPSILKKPKKQFSI
ncbi:unnamed protein product [Adineta steineri]|uniref:EamA domain-containing protein n=1 Tax=Adineta steineri TaxID=433720 RepID=A0A818MNU4_9BILA|nr:unnamed protein product [Adineta steineri]